MKFILQTWNCIWMTANLIKVLLLRKKELYTKSIVNVVNVVFCRKFKSLVNTAVSVVLPVNTTQQVNISI